MKFTGINFLSILGFNTMTMRCDLLVTSDLPPQDAIQIIPKLFHTVWIDFGEGAEPFPHFKENIEKLSTMHPNWEVINWTESEINELIKAEYPQYYRTFSSYNMKIKQHDFCRAILMHKFGGVYVDHDSNSLRNIEPLLKSFEMVFANEKPGRYSPNNGFLASVPEHQFWIHFLDEMSAPGTSLKHVLDSTGPFILASSLKEFTSSFGFDGMKLYSNDFFNPIDCLDKKTGKGMSDDQLREMFPNAYILQQFSSTWWPQLFKTK